jgi:hypothetical protein
MTSKDTNKVTDVNIEEIDAPETVETAEVVDIAVVEEAVDTVVDAPAVDAIEATETVAPAADSNILFDILNGSDTL